MTATATATATGTQSNSDLKGVDVVTLSSADLIHYRNLLAMKLQHPEDTSPCSRVSPGAAPLTTSKTVAEEFNKESSQGLE
ncbi:hypothetical protein P5673_011376 [Acropora cervicornis]|uniref:Uncharacterized protein n=1 Tax=Acropora cervicornis TaxID=6130 RepID=A0AAD9QP23_ACRCE|nr:hypothetical protein P5673_011376 [Acropora cervicornis]